MPPGHSRSSVLADQIPVGDVQIPYEGSHGNLKVRVADAGVQLRDHEIPLEKLKPGRALGPAIELNCLPAPCSSGCRSPASMFVSQ